MQNTNTPTNQNFAIARALAKLSKYDWLYIEEYAIETYAKNKHRHNLTASFYSSGIKPHKRNDNVRDIWFLRPFNLPLSTKEWITTIQQPRNGTAIIVCPHNIYKVYPICRKNPAHIAHKLPQNITIDTFLDEKYLIPQKTTDKSTLFVLDWRSFRNIPLKQQNAIKKIINTLSDIEPLESNCCRTLAFSIHFNKTGSYSIFAHVYNLETQTPLKHSVAAIYNSKCDLKMSRPHAKFANYAYPILEKSTTKRVKK